MAWFFGFFFVSGFCSILYELIWLRLAMAQFGVTTALVSIVLSMFMAGLGAGSWLAGSSLRRYKLRRGADFPPLRLYALAELLIGISALTVPLEFRAGSKILTAMAGQGTVSSLTFYLVSGAILAVTLIPWCACMGATIPLAMFAIREDSRDDSGNDTRRSFSFLYIANLVGSAAGCSVPLLLIEMWGFHSTLVVGAMLNAAIACSAYLVAGKKIAGKTVAGKQGAETRAAEKSALAEKSAMMAASAAAASGPVPDGETAGNARAIYGKSTAPPRANPGDTDGNIHGQSVTLALLFATGFATMGMEVIWIRLFTPYIGPVVYAFALILATYLAATFAGSRFYRSWSRSRDRETRTLWVSLALFGLLPLLTSDVRLHIPSVLRVIFGIGPFAGVIGFLTPMLVDRWSKGDADRAGRAYAMNVVGCVLGPLVSGFILLPLIGEHWSMLLFVIPWVAMLIPQRGADFAPSPRAAAYASVAGALLIFGVTKDFETQFRTREVLRDNTATVIATGSGLGKQLLVNGIGMTSLTPITKMMAHMPLAWIDREPKDALIICFGMGTSSLSALSWGIHTTTVELVPSVPKLVGFFHPGRAAEIDTPRANIVIDDGRRYLERTADTYDLILIDPPPPVSAAASSLLYSEDFYRVAKTHLRPGGIFQQWLPGGDAQEVAAVARSLQDSFSNVRVYRSLEGWGWHFVSSMTPLPDRTPDEFVRRMPPAAIADLLEWGPYKTPQEQFARVLSQPVTLDQLIALSPGTPALVDDRPINEYFLMRFLARKAGLSNLSAHAAQPVGIVAARF